MRKYIPTLVLVLLLIGWALFLDHASDFFIFQPNRQVYNLKPSFQEISFPARNGEKLYALYLPAKENKPTVLFLHGQKHNAYDFQDFALDLNKEGYGVLIPDYRGFGKSKGRPSEKNMKDDAAASFSYMMTDLKLLPKQIVLWGFSLGATPALHVAAQFSKLPIKSLILQSPFTNMTEMGYYVLARKHDHNSPGRKIIVLFLKPLLWNKTFDNVSLIQKVRAPILVGYSQQDATIPWTMSRDLAAKAPLGTAKFMSLTGVHHSFDWLIPTAHIFIESLNTPQETQAQTQNPA